MSRKLATIREIKELQPIEGADRIELAIVDGWQCVVKKGEFKVYDKCVYIEIDSVLPKEEWSSFMEPRKYRVRTARFMGVLSQGLALPLTILTTVSRAVGSDVTVGLKIVQYLSPAEKASRGVGSRKVVKNSWMLRFALTRRLHSLMYPRIKREWPSFLPKTDEERVQNLNNVQSNNSGRSLYHTEKLDGQSATFFYNRDLHISLFKKGLYGVCSRNIWFKRSKINNNWVNYSDDHGIEELLRNYCDGERVSLSVQGELIGPGIQGNRYKLPSHRLYVFSMYNIDEQRYLTMAEKLSACMMMGLDAVPNLGCISSSLSQSEFLEEAEGESMLEDTEREGIVIRDIRNDGYSFKAISNKWLLSHE